MDKVEIFDISGKRLLGKEGFVEESINVSAFEPGIYLLHVTYKGQKAVYKFSKK